MHFKYVLITLLLTTQTLLAMPAQILLIRHGEKPDQGNELSQQGWLRAKALPNLFLKRTDFSTYGLPAVFYAMSPSKLGGSVRAIQTVKFASEQFHVPVETRFTRDQVSELVANIKNDQSLNGKMIVICWEHKVLLDIAAQLGVKQNLSWPSEQYDRVWNLTFDNQGKLKKFQDLPQRLLPSDLQN